MSSIALSVGLFFFFSLANAQQTTEEEVPKYEGPIYQLPKAPPTPINMNIITSIVDGIEHSYAQLKFPGFTAQMPAPRGWVAQARPDTSLTLIKQLSRDIQIRLRLYPAEQFLPDLEDESLIGYVEGLKLNNKKQIAFFESPFGFGPPMRDLVTALERTTSYVHYSITSEDQKLVTKYWEYFVNIDDDYLLQIIFTGPDGKADQLHGQFVRIMKMLTTRTES